MAVVETSPGTMVLVGNRYEVDFDHPIGLGGMATVYRGRDLSARPVRDVALKTLRPEYSENPESRERFRHEAKMMAAVDHPNLISLLDLIDEGRTTWMVMAFVPGQTLKQHVENHGALAPTAILPILDQIVAGLGALHARGLVHLDIKPQNIMLQPDGCVTVIDFGLTQLAGPRQDMIAGTAFGTVAYLAPEQATGSAVDAATDVYSLGSVIYELATGRPPFDAPPGPDQKQRLIQAHLEELATAPSILVQDLPAWIDDVIGWALAKLKSERFHDVATFARMFRSGVEGEMLPSGATSRVSAFNDHHTGAIEASPRRRPRTPGAAGGQENARPAGVPAPKDRAGTRVDAFPGLVERTYRFGGRSIRHTRRIRGSLWRLAFIFAIGNLLLATIITVRDGADGLLANALQVVPGTGTTVLVDGLNVRSGPDVSNRSLGVLEEGASVSITGMPEVAAADRWWPVEAEIAGQSVDGWVWEDGIARDSWMNAMIQVDNVVDVGAGARQTVEDGSNRVGNFWAF